MIPSKFSMCVYCVFSSFDKKFRREISNQSSIRGFSAVRLCITTILGGLSTRTEKTMLICDCTRKIGGKLSSQYSQRGHSERKCGLTWREYSLQRPLVHRDGSGCWGTNQASYQARLCLQHKDFSKHIFAILTAKNFVQAALGLSLRVDYSVSSSHHATPECSKGPEHTRNVARVCHWYWMYQGETSGSLVVCITLTCVQVFKSRDMQRASGNHDKQDGNSSSLSRGQPLVPVEAHRPRDWRQVTDWATASCANRCDSSGLYQVRPMHSSEFS